MLFYLNVWKIKDGLRKMTQKQPDWLSRLEKEQNKISRNKKLLKFKPLE